LKGLFLGNWIVECNFALIIGDKSEQQFDLPSVSLIDFIVELRVGKGAAFKRTHFANIRCPAIIDVSLDDVLVFLRFHTYLYVIFLADIKWKRQLICKAVPLI
jgi:hypothetical protein